MLCRPLEGMPIKTSPGIDRRGIDDLLFLQDADDEAGEIVFAVGKIAGVLGGLAADQRAARLTAAGRDAAHDRFGDFDIELAADEIVQEKTAAPRLGSEYR